MASTTDRCGCGARPPSSLGALVCGLLIDAHRARHLIWIIAGWPRIGALAQPRAAAAGRIPGSPQPGSAWRRPRLLRDRRLSRCYRGIGADPGQPRRLLYLRFDRLAASRLRRADDCRRCGSLGVLAEIVLFALSPRVHPAAVDAGRDRRRLSAAARWVITAQDPPLAILAIVQLAHALSFGLTQVGIMGLMRASRARPCDGARAGLSDRLRRHRRKASPRSRPARSTRAGGRASIT